MEELAPASRRVLAAAEGLGLAVTIRIMPDSTRTAMEAASACACLVDQIVKSLVFRGRASGKPYLLLVSGINRVDETKAGAAIGEELERPNAAFVRDATGFAIGGVSPLGASQPIPVFFDPHLLDFELVYAAAGTPNTIFSIDPKALAAALNARTIAMT